MARPAPERSVYWALPNLFVLGLALVAVVGGIVLVAVGHTILGSAVLALAILGVLVLAQEAARHELVASGYSRVRELSGYAGLSVRTWSRTSHRVAALRLEAARLLRQRRELLLALGAATYAGDGAAFALTEQLRAVDARLAECAAESERLIASAQSRVAAERLTIGSTEIRRAR
ncbi:MAG: hypothetical protein JO186_04835 [Actinobacteria bacterium]|nr:hypothetical protein [Actinomycetota bacterium]MBV8396644.1 hypothetical protein [Actinomycetota bacterium]